MLAIEKINRSEIENEFMALLLNRNELLDVIQIKPEFLKDKKNQKLLKQILECYKEHGVVNLQLISEKHKDFNFDWWSELYTDTFYYQSAWEEQLRISEESILKFFKEDVISKYHSQLEKQEITYEKFMEQMKTIGEFQLADKTSTLTKKEILENIDDKATIVLRNYETLNRTLQLVQGDFLIIGATTGTGKSSFMLNLMNDIADRYQCIYFNMEMSKSTLYKRLVSIRGNIPVYDVNSPKTDYQKEIIARTLDEIEKSKIIIENKATDISKIRSVIIQQKDPSKHTVVFIDHLGLTRVEDKRSLYEQATEVAKQLRQLCLDYDCTIISASQLNRGAYNSEELSLSMLKDSGELENSASKVILLYRDKESSKEDLIVDMDIEIVKNRDGRLGFVKMEYDKSKQIFKEK